jgi:hypothetical protein
MNIPLTIGDYSGYSGEENASELINMMVETDAEGGIAAYMLIGTPGLKEYIETHKTGAGRGGFSFPGCLLTVIGKNLMAVDTETDALRLLAYLGTSSGRVMFCQNTTQVLLIDGEKGYIIDKEAKGVIRILDEDFPIPLACAWKDGYGVVVEKDTGIFFVSAINDFTSWDALDFASAEFQPDNLVSCGTTPSYLVAFGETTTQFYYNSGNATFPFDSQQGANILVGCGATFSPAAAKNSIFWLDDNFQVRRIEGYNTEIISTKQIEHRISKLTSVEDAVGSCFTTTGHTIYCLTFPTDGLTLMYDLSTGKWHRRTSGINNAPFRAAWIVSEGNTVYAGDYANGKIYKLDQDTFTDNGNLNQWSFTLANVNSEQSMIQHNMLELHIESGIGLNDGIDPNLWMQYSDDGGKTWSHEKWANMGKIGESKIRQRFFNLGMSRFRTYKISGSCPTKKVVISAKLNGNALGY